MFYKLCEMLLGPDCGKIVLGGEPSEILCRRMFGAAYIGRKKVRNSEALKTFGGEIPLSPQVARTYLDPGGVLVLEKDMEKLVEAYHSITMLRQVCQGVGDWISLLPLHSDDAAMLEARRVREDATRQEMAHYLAAVMYIAIRELY